MHVLSLTGKGKEPKPQSEEPKIEDFMEMMDRELSKTHIGKSFEKQPKATNTTTKQVRLLSNDFFSSE